MKICIIGECEFCYLIRMTIKKSVEKYTFDTFENSNIVISNFYDINTEKYQNKKFIFLPSSLHLTDSFNNFLSMQRNNHTQKNCIYIQPEYKIDKLWTENFKDINIPIKTHIFGICTDFLYKNISTKNNKCFINNQCDGINIDKIHKILTDKNIISVTTRDISLIKTSMFGIWATNNTCYDFFLYETLARNIPLIVLIFEDTNVKTICDLEYYTREIYTKNIPYWSKECGEIIYVSKSDIENHWLKKFIEVYHIFLLGIEKNIYKPRDYVIENLSFEKALDSLSKYISY